MEANWNHPTLKIGEVARRFGLNVHTLWYYKGLGLLPAARRESGYRVYSEADAERLAFVLRAKRVWGKLFAHAHPQEVCAGG